MFVGFFLPSQIPLHVIFLHINCLSCKLISYISALDCLPVFLHYKSGQRGHCVSVFTNLKKIELKKGLHSIQVHTVVHHVPQRTTPVKGLSLTILALK